LFNHPYTTVMRGGQKARNWRNKAVRKKKTEFRRHDSLSVRCRRAIVWRRPVVFSMQVILHLKRAWIA